MRHPLKTWAWGLCAVALTAPAALAQDNVEGPWGCANGDIFGRARSDAIPMNFGTGTGAAEAWRFLPSSVGSARVGGWGPLVFDAQGNLYWRTTLGNNKMSSVTPAGTHRWNAQRAGGGDYVFGSGWNSTAPIIGGDRVYALGGGVGFVNGDSASPHPDGDPVVAAFNKNTGALIWERFLPEPTNWADNQQPTPILYNGKIYVVGPYDIGLLGVNVYQIDATTGALDWSSSVSGWLQNGPAFGTMAFVPNAFSPNHGLFYQSVSGSGTDGGGELTGFSIDPTPGTGGATFVWTSDGGLVARGHVIYSSVANRLYTHTWTDYGAELYAFNLLTGAPVANNNAANYGHGFYDVGVLGWDDMSVIAGGFSGGVIRYTDNGTGTTTDAVYKFTDNNFTGCPPSPAGCAKNWFGEYRVFGQLLKDKAGNSVLVSGTNSRVNADTFDPLCPEIGAAPYPCLTARAVVINLDTAFDRNSLEDGAMLVDDVVVEEGPDLANLTPIHSENFETYANGAINGQNGWVDDNVAPSGTGTQTSIVNDPTSGGQGKVMFMDANGSGGGWVGAYKDIPDTTGAVIRRVRWKQWRADTGDNVWIAFGTAPNDFASTWWIQWDQGGLMDEQAFGGAGSQALTAGQWQNVVLTYDGTTNEAKLSIDGNETVANIDVAYAIRGLDFQLEGTAFTNSSVPEDVPMVAFDTGVNSQNGFTLRGGPLVGPDGKMYYFHNATTELVALRPNFMKADADCNGTLNGLDIDDFTQALLDPVAYDAAHVCDILAGADINNDGSADFDDVSLFVMCLLQ